MPRRSKVITTLPAPIRKEVERRMLARRFSDYEGLAQWVREQGYDISDDSLWRYGQSLKREFMSARFSLFQARILAEQAPDHKGRMMQAVIQVVQRKLLLTLAEAETIDNAHLCRLAHAVADLARVYFPQQRWVAEVRKQKKERRRREEAAIIEEDLEELALEEEEELTGDSSTDEDPDDIRDVPDKGRQE
jgi:Protein of unknown function (DUF3486)